MTAVQVADQRMAGRELTRIVLETDKGRPSIQKPLPAGTPGGERNLVPFPAKVHRGGAQGGPGGPPHLAAGDFHRRI